MDAAASMTADHLPKLTFLPYHMPATDLTQLVIGLDAREAFRQNPRGIGLYARHLMRELGALCPEHRFLLYHERPTPPDLPPVPANMRPVRAEVRGSRWHAWERALMPWRLRRDGLSVYHGTYNTLPPRWPIWRGPPMVVTIHDVIVTWWNEDLHDSYVRYCRRVTGRVVRDAAAILTVSEWSKGDIVQRYGADPEKITVFYNGVHPDFLAGAPPGAGDAARQRFADGRGYLFAIGSPLARKNTGAMLDALGVLAKRRRLQHLVLISGLDATHQRAFRERAARAGLEHQVRFLPYLDRADLIAVYAGADLAVYPSRIEGWGIPVVEALVLGTPVVTSASSGMLEAGGPHATYFDPDDLESMAHGIETALDRRAEFAPIRAAAIERARGFTWRRAAEVTLATYRAVAR
jgi:glycosyltransferase involved in cell wall biosynthesis